MDDRFEEYCEDQVIERQIEDWEIEQDMKRQDALIRSPQNLAAFRAYVQWHTADISEEERRWIMHSVTNNLNVLKGETV